jgi:hypothetical protein
MEVRFDVGKDCGRINLGEIHAPCTFMYRHQNERKKHFVKKESEAFQYVAGLSMYLG